MDELSDGVNGHKSSSQVEIGINKLYWVDWHDNEPDYSWNNFDPTFQARSSCEFQA